MRTARTRRRTIRRGGTTVLVLTSVVALTGMSGVALDAGRLYNEKQKAQAAADAAALAGAQDIPNATRARTSAQRAATGNGFSSPEIVFYPNEANPLQIQVRCRRTVPMVFNAILGTSQSTVAGFASCSRTPPPNQMQGIVPLGVQLVDFSYGDQKELKIGTTDGPDIPGNFMPLDLAGGGADSYGEWLKYGFTGKIEVGQTLVTKTGNMVGPTNAALEHDDDSRFNRAEVSPWNDDSWSSFDRGNARIVTIPIVDWLSVDGGGRVNLEVLGFAAFWVDNWQNGGGGTITGHFIQYTDTNHATYDPDLSPGYDGGVWIMRLDA